MKKSITKNYIYNLLYQIMVILIPLITAPYLSRVLGASNIGIYSYTSSISSIFILFGSLGITLYGQRQIAYEQKNKKKYSYTFWEIIILKFSTMLISLLIYYFLFVVGSSNYNIYFKILIIELLGSAIDISWFYQGLEEFKKTVIRNIIVRIISLLLILTFVKKPEDLSIYFLIYVITNLFGNISLWFNLPDYLNKIKIKKIKIIRHLKPTLALFIPQIAIHLYTVLDKTMIGIIINDKSEVGYYEQAQKIIQTLLTLITSLSTVMMPRIANIFLNGEKNEIIEYIKKSICLVFIISLPIIFGILSVSDLFVPLFFGKGFDRVAVLMKTNSPVILLIGLGSITGTQFLLPTNRQKEYTISVVVGACVNFVANFLLIRKLGALGASIGTVFAELTVTSVQLYFLRKDFKIFKMLYLCKNYLLASVIMFFVCLFVRQFIINSLLSIVVQFFVGSLVYLFVLLILKDNFVYSILYKIKSNFTK